MMEVDVEEDWTRTVIKIPITSPTIGFCRYSFCIKLPKKLIIKNIYKAKSLFHLPVDLPDIRVNAADSKSKEHTNKYKKLKTKQIFTIFINIFFHFASEKDQILKKWMIFFG